jgi:hypothetical protein
MTPNFFFSSFLAHKYEYQKYTEFYADVKSVEIIGKKYTQKVICPNVSQVTRVRRRQTQQFRNFETLKPNSQETAQNFENMFYKSVLELRFTLFYP